MTIQSHTFDITGEMWAVSSHPTPRMFTVTSPTHVFQLTVNLAGRHIWILHTRERPDASATTPKLEPEVGNLIAKKQAMANGALIYDACIHYWTAVIGLPEDDLRLSEEEFHLNLQKLAKP